MKNIVAVISILIALVVFVLPGFAQEKETKEWDVEFVQALEKIRSQKKTGGLGYTITEEESLEKAIAMCAPSEKIFIIGGAEVFRQAFGLTTKILLTVLERSAEGGVSFPEIPEDDFREISRVCYPDGSEPFTVITYKKIIPE